MTNRDHAALALLDRFTALFGDPKTDEIERFVDEWCAALRGQVADDLRIAGDRLCRTSRFFPRAAEVFEIADKLARERRDRRDHEIQQERDAALFASKRATKTEEARAAVKSAFREAMRALTPDYATDVPPNDRTAFETMRAGSPNPQMHEHRAPRQRRQA